MQLNSIQLSCMRQTCKPTKTVGRLHTGSVKINNCLSGPANTSDLTPANTPAEPEEADECQEGAWLQRHRLHRVGRLQEPVVPGLHVADDLVHVRVLQSGVHDSSCRGAGSCAACVLLPLGRSQSRLRSFPDLQLRMTSLFACRTA